MRIARDKDALVAAHLVSKSGSFQWGVSFIRAAHDWEVDVVASFFTLLHSIRVGSLPYLGRLVIVIDRCCMCKMNGKSVDHLLLIVRVHALYGMLSLVASVCLALCLFGW